MVDLYSTALISISIVVAGIIALKTRISSSIFEVIIGILIANVLGVGLAPWLDFLGTFGGLILTFLAGAEVEFVLLRSRAKESFSIGFLAFLAPLLGVFLFLSLVTGWSLQAKLSASLALTTTSVAVVYAVLTEYDLIKGSIAKTIIASTFVNDILTLIGINLVAPSFDIITIVFVGLLLLLVYLVPRLLGTVVKAYGGRSVEIEFRLVLASLLGVSFFADEAKLHAVFGAFILGLIFANSIQQHQQVLSKLRTVTFGLLAPAFFVKAGMLISLAAVSSSLLLVVGVLIAKLVSKFIGTYWLCRKWIPQAPMFSTMLFSTGLTVGTITATLGRDLGFLDSAQFTITVVAVILSAIVPTLISKRFVPTSK
ncbi:MAG: cation:proton antiporter [Thaumarchaeota archaeon]|nr:cation:proton antiporter [Nitrososphaerota archaeon]